MGTQVDGFRRIGFDNQRHCSVGRGYAQLPQTSIPEFEGFRRNSFQKQSIVPRLPVASSDAPQPSSVQSSMSQHNLMNQRGSLIGGQQQQQEENYEDLGFLLIEIRDSTAAELDIFNVLIATVPSVDRRRR